MDDDKIKSEASAEPNGGSKHFKSEDEALKAGYSFVFKDEAGGYIGFTDVDEAYGYQLERAKKESVSYHSAARAQAAGIETLSETLKSANEATTEMKRLFGETPEPRELIGETFTPIRKAADRFLAIFKEHEGRTPDKPYPIRNIPHLVSVILYESENRPTIGVGDLISYYDGMHPDDRQRFMEYDLRYIQGEINKVYNMSLHEMAVSFGKGIIEDAAAEQHATFSDRCDQLDLLMSQVWELYGGRYGCSPKGEFEKWAKDIHYPVDLFGFNPNKRMNATPQASPFLRNIPKIHKPIAKKIIDTLRERINEQIRPRAKCKVILIYVELGYLKKPYPSYDDFASEFFEVNEKGKHIALIKQTTYYRYIGPNAAEGGKIKITNRDKENYKLELEL